MPSQRHVEACRPGELVHLDCSYVGNLKGAGKVWKITARGAASIGGQALPRKFVRMLCATNAP